MKQRTLAMQQSKIA